MNIFPENFSNEFNIFLSNINNLYPNEEILSSINNEILEKKIERIQKFVNLLNSTTNFNNLCKCKIKLFSHKEKDTLAISESIFGKKLSLKKIFNNQTDDIKDKLWLNLQKLILFILEEETKIKPSKQLNEKIAKLSKQLNEKIEKLSIKSVKIDQTKKSIQHLFQTDKLNNTTNDMINDIFKSFEGAMTGKDTMNSILNLSSELTKKYEDKINNGEIDLNSLVNNLKNNIPGMENMKNIIDPLLNMDNLTSLVGGTTESKEKIIMDENFSTANIEIGKEEETSKPIIGNMLKVADNTGILNMITGSTLSNNNDSNNNSNDDSNNNLNNLLNGFNMSDGQNNSFNKLFDIVNKLKDTGLGNREELNKVFKNELGIDVEQINKQMESVMQKNNIIEE